MLKNNYGIELLRRCRKFYILNIKSSTLSSISWSHIVELLPIKNENERNYYINQIILNHLSVRELRQEIKNKAFDRLSYADKNNISIITDNSKPITIQDMIKDPIILNINHENIEFDEKVLHELLIKQLENRFLALGVGFTLAGHEYKIQEGKHTFRIDLLFFNYKLNAFVVVEVKVNNMTHRDVDQVNHYVSLVDTYVKERDHFKTIGILIAKEKDRYVIKYATDKDILITTYQLNSF